MIGIYVYTNRVNGKKYVGKSTNIEARQGKHRRNAKDGRESYFYRAIRKYGLEQFDFEVLEECSEEELNKREKYYIELYNALYPGGYNLTEGGTGGDPYKNRTEAQNRETRIKMSQSHKGKKHSPEAPRRSIPTFSPVNSTNFILLHSGVLAPSLELGFPLSRKAR